MNSILIDTSRTLKLLVPALLLLGTATFIWTAVHLLGYPYDLHAAEGFMLRPAAVLLETGDITSATLYHALLAAIGGYTGISFSIGRAVNLLAVTAIVGVLSLLLREHGTRFTALFPLLVFGSIMSLYAGVTVQPITLAVLFNVLGLYLFLREHYYAGIVSFLLAVFTWPMAVAGIIAGITYVFTQYPMQSWSVQDLRKTPATLSVCLFIGAVLLAAVVLETWSGGLSMNLLGTVGGWKIQWAWFTWMHLTLFPLFGAALFYTYFFENRLFNTYFLAALAIGILQFLQAGSMAEAMLEPFVAGILCLGLLYTEAPKMRNILLILIVFQIGLFFITPATPGSLFDVHTLPADNRVADAYIAEALASSPAYIDTAGFAWETNSVFPPSLQTLRTRRSNADIQAFFQKQNYSQIIISQHQLETLPLEPHLATAYRELPSVTRHDLQGAYTVQVFSWKSGYKGR